MRRDTPIMVPQRVHRRSASRGEMTNFVPPSPLCVPVTAHVLLLVAACRANWLPVYLAPAFVVGFLASAFLGHGWVVNVVPSAVALAAMAVVGVRVLRMTDREFATGAHQA